MRIEEQAVRIERLIRLINYSDTGTTGELAKKMCVTRRTILLDIEFMKGKGYQIVFCRECNSYQFEKTRNNFSFFEKVQWDYAPGF